MLSFSVAPSPKPKNQSLEITLLLRDSNQPSRFFAWPASCVRKQSSTSKSTKGDQPRYEVVIDASSAIRTWVSRFGSVSAAHSSGLPIPLRSPIIAIPASVFEAISKQTTLHSDERKRADLVVSLSSLAHPAHSVSLTVEQSRKPFVLHHGKVYQISGHQLFEQWMRYDGVIRLNGVHRQSACVSKPGKDRLFSAIVQFLPSSDTVKFMTMLNKNESGGTRSILCCGQVPSLSSLSSRSDSKDSSSGPAAQFDYVFETHDARLGMLRMEAYPRGSVRVSSGSSASSSSGYSPLMTPSRPVSAANMLLPLSPLSSLATSDSSNSQDSHVVSSSNSFTSTHRVLVLGARPADSPQLPKALPPSPGSQPNVNSVIGRKHPRSIDRAAAKSIPDQAMSTSTAAVACSYSTDLPAPGPSVPSILSVAPPRTVVVLPPSHGCGTKRVKTQPEPSRIVLDSDSDTDTDE